MEIVYKHDILKEILEGLEEVRCLNRKVLHFNISKKWFRQFIFQKGLDSTAAAIGRLEREVGISANIVPDEEVDGFRFILGPDIMERISTELDKHLNNEIEIDFVNLSSVDYDELRDLVVTKPSPGFEWYPDSVVYRGIPIRPNIAIEV